jgi:hypothetical protein
MMSAIDHSLIYQALKFATGANIHSVGNWIFCYQSLKDDSPTRQHYESLLRGFVLSSRLMEARALSSAVARDPSEAAR